jgi:hypothetical protein
MCEYVTRRDSLRASYTLPNATSRSEAYATDDTEAGVAMVVGQTAMIPPYPIRVGPSCASYPRINLDTSEVPRSI